MSDAYVVQAKVIVIADNWKEAANMVSEALKKVPHILNYFEITVSEASQEDLMKTKLISMEGG